MNSNTKLTVVLLADASTHENLGRALHALLYAKQARAAGMEAEVIFDGGGVEWPVQFADEQHKLHPVYRELVEDGVIAGVCHFCSGAFEVTDEIEALDGVTSLSENDGHPDIGARIADGNTVITL